MSAPTIVVSMGTYFHPFDRLLDWIEPWAQAHPEVLFVVQHGPGRPLDGALNHEFVAYDYLLELFAAADVLVLQGGAGGVMDARELGRVPIVVPRRPVNDEVVDSHQLIFTGKAAELGLVHCADSRDDLWALLDGALDGSVPTRHDEHDRTPGSARLSALLADSPDSLPLAARRRRLARSLRLLVGSGGRAPKERG